MLLRLTESLSYSRADIESRFRMMIKQTKGKVDDESSTEAMFKI